MKRKIERKKRSKSKVELKNREFSSDKGVLKLEHDINNDLIPIIVSDSNRSLVPVKDLKSDPLTVYIREIGKYKLLSREQEDILTRQLAESGDIDIAKQLVVANLRLVVKIAMEYRSAYANTMDLIQEGNIGLMKAVSKFNPDKGAKISYYASWWIRSYILKYILDNFNLVKIGTNNIQKKLFYNLQKEKRRLESMGIRPSVKMISENLGVPESAVTLMEQRLGPQGGEISLDRPLSDDIDSDTIINTIVADGPTLEDEVAKEQELSILNKHLKNFLDSLKDRDREIFKKRLLSEVPPSLQLIADEYGVSRERIRQIEERLLKNLKVYMSDFIR